VIVSPVELKAQIKSKVNHIVALSGGKDSTAMALRLRELHPETDFDFICTPTGNELPEMVEHWLLLGHLLGTPLKPITSGQSLAGLIRRWNALPNWRQRWCTRVLKIEPFENYILARRPCVVYVGIRADEQTRDGVDYEKHGQIERRFPLCDWGWGLDEVLAYLELRGVSIPDRTDCAGCFFQTLYEWYLLWRNRPEEYEECCKWEDATGHTLRSEQRDTWPASLRLLAAEFVAGRVPTQRRKMADRPTMCSVCSR